MKSFILSILLIGCVFTAYSQDPDINTGNHYVSLIVKYGLKKNKGIVNDLFINIGTTKDHPLYGLFTNVDDAVVVKDGQDQFVITNEVDMLSYLKKKGWVISYSAEIKVLGSPCTQYFLTEMNRQ